MHYNGHMQDAKPTRKDFIVIDTETTGFSYKYHRIIEVGAVRVRNGKVVEEYQELVDSVVFVPKVITNLTGITTEMIAKKGKSPKKVFSELREFIGNDLFAAHNVYFDFNFLNAEFSRNSNSLLDNGRICTMRTSKRALPRLPNHKLTTIKEFLELEYESHRALTDAYVSLEILSRYWDCARTYTSAIDTER